MEIRNIEENVKINYPTSDELSTKNLEQSIPKKWCKLGINSFVFGLLSTKKVFAISPSEINPSLSGGAPMPAPTIFTYIAEASFVVLVVTAITFLISVLLFIKNKIKAKKENKKIKISKKLELSIIISGILFVASVPYLYLNSFELIGTPANFFMDILTSEITVVPLSLFVLIITSITFLISILIFIKNKIKKKNKISKKLKLLIIISGILTVSYSLFLFLAYIA